MILKFKPLGSNVLINPFPLDPKTKEGVILLHNEHHNLQKGVVVTQGNGVPGSKKQISVKDIVLFPVRAGIRILLDEQEFYIINENDIIAKV